MKGTQNTRKTQNTKNLKKEIEEMGKEIKKEIEGTEVSQDAKDIVNALKAEVITENDVDAETVKKEAENLKIEQKVQDILDLPKEEDKPKDKEEEDNKPTDKEEEKPKSKLIPKAWQRVSDDGKSLLNRITFLGEQKDYEVGMKHQYRFPNLSVSDGLKRIITAKFPKEGMLADTQVINVFGYELTIEKFGSSAVCKLKDEDGICLLEFVSLATVIDVLQDEVNTKECETSWGTIDQIIKYKRGLKSRVKAVDVNDKPTRAPKEEVKEEKKEIVDTNVEKKAGEVATDSEGGGEDVKEEVKA